MSNAVLKKPPRRTEPPAAAFQRMAAVLTCLRKAGYAKIDEMALAEQTQAEGKMFRLIMDMGADVGPAFESAAQLRKTSLSGLENMPF